MDHFAGLDVSVKQTSVCIVDDTGKIVREAKVASADSNATAHHQLCAGMCAGTISVYVCFWPLADNPTAPAFVRYWSNSGHRADLSVCPL